MKVISIQMLSVDCFMDLLCDLVCSWLMMAYVVCWFDLKRLVVFGCLSCVVDGFGDALR